MVTTTGAETRVCSQLSCPHRNQTSRRFRQKGGFLRVFWLQARNNDILRSARVRLRKRTVGARSLRYEITVNVDGCVSQSPQGRLRLPPPDRQAEARPQFVSKAAVASLLKTSHTKNVGKHERTPVRGARPASLPGTLSRGCCEGETCKHKLLSVRPRGAL